MLALHIEIGVVLLILLALVVWQIKGFSENKIVKILMYAGVVSVMLMVISELLLRFEQFGVFKNSLSLTFIFNFLILTFWGGVNNNLGAFCVGTKFS